jgi:hypothetical protein
MLLSQVRMCTTRPAKAKSKGRIVGVDVTNLRNDVVTVQDTVRRLHVELRDSMTTINCQDDSNQGTDSKGQ